MEKTTPSWSSLPTDGNVLVSGDDDELSSYETGIPFL